MGPYSHFRQQSFTYHILRVLYMAASKDSEQNKVVRNFMALAESDDDTDYDLGQPSCSSRKPKPVAKKKAVSSTEIGTVLVESKPPEAAEATPATAPTSETGVQRGKRPEDPIAKANTMYDLFAEANQSSAFFGETHATMRRSLARRCLIHIPTIRVIMSACSDVHRQNLAYHIR
jgi:hypothetical protein